MIGSLGDLTKLKTLGKGDFKEVIQTWHNIEEEQEVIEEQIDEAVEDLNKTFMEIDKADESIKAEESIDAKKTNGASEVYSTLSKMCVTISMIFQIS